MKQQALIKTRKAAFMVVITTGILGVSLGVAGTSLWFTYRGQSPSHISEESIDPAAPLRINLRLDDKKGEDVDAWRAREALKRAQQAYSYFIQEQPKILHLSSQHQKTKQKLAKSLVERDKARIKWEKARDIYRQARSELNKTKEQYAVLLRERAALERNDEVRNVAKLRKIVERFNRGEDIPTLKESPAESQPVSSLRARLDKHIDELEKSIAHMTGKIAHMKADHHRAREHWERAEAMITDIRMERTQSRRKLDDMAINIDNIRTKTRDQAVRSLALLGSLSGDSHKSIDTLVQFIDDNPL